MALRAQGSKGRMSEWCQGRGCQLGPKASVTPSTSVTTGAVGVGHIHHREDPAEAADDGAAVGRPALDRERRAERDGLARGHVVEHRLFHAVAALAQAREGDLRAVGRPVRPGLVWILAGDEHVFTGDEVHEVDIPDMEPMAALRSATIVPSGEMAWRSKAQCRCRTGRRSARRSRHRRPCDRCRSRSVARRGGEDDGFAIWCEQRRACMEFSDHRWLVPAHCRRQLRSRSAVRRTARVATPSTVVDDIDAGSPVEDRRAVGAPGQVWEDRGAGRGLERLADRDGVRAVGAPDHDRERALKAGWR